MKKSSKGKMCMDGLRENWLTLATFAGVLVGTASQWITIIFCRNIPVIVLELFCGIASKGKEIQGSFVLSTVWHCAELFSKHLFFAGIGLGIGLRSSREEPWTKREAELYVGFLGNLFLNMLKCIIIPLVIPSLITAIGKSSHGHRNKCQRSS